MIKALVETALKIMLLLEKRLTNREIQHVTTGRLFPCVLPFQSTRGLADFSIQLITLSETVNTLVNVRHVRTIVTWTAFCYRELRSIGLDNAQVFWAMLIAYSYDLVTAKVACRCHHNDAARPIAYDRGTALR